MTWLRRVRILVGALVWIAVGAATARLLTETRDSGKSNTLALISDYVAAEPIELEIEITAPRFLELGDTVSIAPGGDIETGDNETGDNETGDKQTNGGQPGAVAAIGAENGNGSVADAGQPIGVVVALVDESGNAIPRFYHQSVRVARIRIFDRAAADLRADASARLLLVPDALDWVVDTLITSDNIPQLAFEWNKMMLRHREEIFRLLTPIVRDVVRDIEATVEESFGAFVARHRDKTAKIGAAMRSEFDTEALREVVAAEVFPIAEAKLRPVFDSISARIWDKAPLWSFTWRVAVQSLPLTDDDYVETAWNRFAREEVRPILQDHLDEIVGASKEIAAAALASDGVRDQLRGMFAKLLDNSDFHALAQIFIKETFLDNRDFHERMLTRLRSPEVQRALDAASRHVEPMLRRMGDIIFGTRQAGITTEFARVLRAQILRKDRRRFVLTRGSDPRRLQEGTRLRASVEWDNPK